MTLGEEDRRMRERADSWGFFGRKWALTLGPEDSSSLLCPLSKGRLKHGKVTYRGMSVLGCVVDGSVPN